uniref:Uncharacterized protein n=1 Tax=Micrurus spixii TaxID=129469 RepID=A0A2D4MTY1_9SAUR
MLLTFCSRFFRGNMTFCPPFSLLINPVKTDYTSSSDNGKRDLDSIKQVHFCSLFLSCLGMQFVTKSSELLRLESNCSCPPHSAKLPFFTHQQLNGQLLHCADYSELHVRSSDACFVVRFSLQASPNLRLVRGWRKFQNKGAMFLP